MHPPFSSGSVDEERDSRLVGGPSRTTTSLQRLLPPAKAATTSSKTPITQLASRVIRGERSQVFHAGVVAAPRAIRAAAGVFKHHSTHSNAHVFFVPFLMTELQMALLSAARPASPPIPEEDRRANRGGVAQLGVSRRGRLFVVCAFGRWAASAPRPSSRSGFCAGSRLRVVRLVVGGAVVRVGRNARASAVWRWQWR